MAVFKRKRTGKFRDALLDELEKRFDRAAYRAALAKPAIAAGSVLQAVGAALEGAL